MVIAYKGFESDMTCRGFQYELGKIYSISERPIICRQGFHACILPIDVIMYYPYGTNVYAEVSLSECDSTKDLYVFSFNTKICGKSIWISPHIMSISELIYETFHLLDQLFIFARFDGTLPSERYYRTAKTSIEQLKAAESINIRIKDAICFAHRILDLIIHRLKVSRRIYNVEDFIQIVIKLQQKKDEEHVANV